MEKMTNTVATVIVTTPNNQIVLQERDNNPEIESPGAFSLVSGFVLDHETPLEGAIRELGEEFVGIDTSDGVHFSKLTYLGTNARYDYDRTDYVFQTCLLDNPDSVKIREGKGFVIMDIGTCLNERNLAYHHKIFLMRYLQIIQNRYQGNYSDDYRTIQIEDLYRLDQLAASKDLDQLENGLGFVVSDTEKFSGLVHSEEDIKFIGCLQFVPGKPRGYHYHLRKVEYMLILKGTLKTKLELPGSDTNFKDVIWGEGQLMTLLPGVVHTLTAQGSSNVVAIEFSPQRYLSKDVYKGDK